MKKLVIIDGNAILHRAYHALPPLTDPKGEVVNAVYGFFSMLLNLLSDQKPDYLAVCFDRGKPTFRQELFVGYHAHRPALASDFIPQFGFVQRVLDRMRVQTFGVEGYEADDLIGTIARRVADSEETMDNRKSKIGQEDRNLKMENLSSTIQFRPQSSITHHPSSSIETIIVTGDRDLLQLVDQQTKVLMLITGLTKTALFDEEAVEEKYGVQSRQFIDYKALIGDASDGYPGVTGIGPKTAATLLQKYQTFENLYGHVGDLPERQSLQLATDAEQAALAKKLATIICDVPIRFNVEKCKTADFNVAGLEDSFEELGFKSLLKRLITVFPDLEERKEKGKLLDGQMGLL